MRTVTAHCADLLLLLVTGTFSRFPLYTKCTGLVNRTTMAIPPVATHASRVLPPMLLRAGVTYACLQFLQSRTRNALILSIPNWLVVVLSIIAVPVITRVEAFIKEHKYERDAVLNGATTAYTIPLSAWEVVTELRKSFTTSATPSKFSN